MRRVVAVSAAVAGLALVANAAMAQPVARPDWPPRGPFADWPDNAEKRTQFFDELVRRRLQQYTREYELTEQQQASVEARLKELKQEQVAYIEPLLPEYRKIAAEAEALRRSAQNGALTNRKRMRELSQRQMEILTNGPLWGMKLSATIEKMLPPEQVAKARDEETRRYAAATQAAASQFAPDQVYSGPGLPTSAEQLEQNRRFLRERAARAKASADQRPWRWYVTRFIKRFELDKSQQATAESILRDMNVRHAAYCRDHAVEYEAASRLQTLQAMHARERELEKPIQEMFDELKSRLDAVPTKAQVEKVRQYFAEQEAGLPERFRRPATRPADLMREPMAASMFAGRPWGFAQSQPAGNPAKSGPPSTTRPALPGER